MADRTSGGQMASDKSRLAARRIALQIHQNQGSIMQAELDIENFEDQIRIRRTQIAATQEQNVKLSEDLERIKAEGKE